MYAAAENWFISIQRKSNNLKPLGSYGGLQKTLPGCVQLSGVNLKDIGVRQQSCNINRKSEMRTYNIQWDQTLISIAACRYVDIVHCVQVPK
jgi:hypothetical protein